jgi:hypothetical protein
MRVINRNLNRWNDGVGAYMGTTMKRESTHGSVATTSSVEEYQKTESRRLMIKSDVQDMFRKNALPPFSG